MTELKLRLQERYALIPLLPHTGNFQLLTRTKNLIAALELTDAEQEARGLDFNGEQITVRAGTDGAEVGRVTALAIHDEQMDIVLKTLKDCETNSTLPLSLIEAYQRIVLDPQNEVVREAEAVAEGVSE